MIASPASWMEGTRLNYTLINETLSAANEDYSYLAPRYQLEVYAVAAKDCNFSPSTWPYSGLSGNDDCYLDEENCFYKLCTTQAYTGQFLLTDSDLEKRMTLGRGWVFILSIIHNVDV